MTESLGIKCPKCGNLADAQAAYCGVCYEVFGKPRSTALAETPVLKSGPSNSPSPAWTPTVIAAALILFAALVPLRMRVMNALWFLDFVNLAFHEGGHMVFMILGLGNRFIMVCGGTAMQLLLPASAAWQFHQRREKVSAACAVWWFGQNFLGVGNYIADARAQRLDLVAGGVHDWTYLLETTGLLSHDEGIGKFVQILGCLIMAFAAVAVWIYARAAAREDAA